jgi:transketolase
MILAANYKLYNLLLIVDRNFAMTLDRTEDVMKLENLQKKIKSFGFETDIIDGHNYSNILKKFKKFKKKKKGPPMCIIARTKKGKGSNVMESDLKFHHGVPNQTEYENILKDLG